ncbi:hypothetical protein VNI00_015957, partial [Paramarasmius palmivorus]
MGERGCEEVLELNNKGSEITDINSFREFLTNWAALYFFCSYPSIIDILDPSFSHVNLYEFLGVARDASVEEIKAAYRQKLLKHHPDKVQQANSTSTTDVELITIKNAYDTLSSPALRAQYDAGVFGNLLRAAGSRPAQVVSLDEFEEVDTEGQGAWRYRCRCGGFYRVTEADMEKGLHLMGCDCCSEAVW